jgi:hypothetical protein
MKNIFTKIFTIIFIIYICFLCANPWTLKMNKYNVYTNINSQYKLKTHLYEYEELKNIHCFPVIIKPNMYSGHGSDVCKITNKNELIEYIKKINNAQPYIVQEYYPSKYEVGLLYEKNPFSKNGNIISIVLKKKFDNTWKPLSCDTLFSNKNVCTSIDKPEWITDKLSCVINDISNNVPNFYVGRYDIGFDDIEEFKNGKNFKIFELNGNAGADLRASFKNVSIVENIYPLYYLMRFLIIRILYGFINLMINKHECLIILSETVQRIKLLLKANEASHILSPSF